MTPFDELRVLCSVTETFIPKKVDILSKLSVWDFLDASTSNVLFFSFFTDLGVPITLSICFSITKGERDVTAFSSCDKITINLGNVSFAFENEVWRLVRVVIRFGSLEDSFSVGCHDYYVYFSMAMRFTLRGALQGDV